MGSGLRDYASIEYVYLYRFSGSWINECCMNNGCGVVWVCTAKCTALDAVGNTFCYRYVATVYIVTWIVTLYRHILYVSYQTSLKYIFTSFHHIYSTYDWF